MFKYSLRNNMFIRVAQTDRWTDGQYENIMSNYALLFIPILFYYLLLLLFFGSEIVLEYFVILKSCKLFWQWQTQCA